MEAPVLFSIKDVGVLACVVALASYAVAGGTPGRVVLPKGDVPVGAIRESPLQKGLRRCLSSG
jgi:hypothetical protein